MFLNILLRAYSGVGGLADVTSGETGSGTKSRMYLRHRDDTAQQGFGVWFDFQQSLSNSVVLACWRRQEYTRRIYEAVYHVHSVRALLSSISNSLRYNCMTFFHAQLSVHSAFFFSAKAFIPTFWSLLPNKLWKTLLSYSTPSRRGRSWLLFTTSFAAMTATLL
jgi:hypothetical protein